MLRNAESEVEYEVRAEGKPRQDEEGNSYRSWLWLGLALVSLFFLLFVAVHLYASPIASGPAARTVPSIGEVYSGEGAVLVNNQSNMVNSSGIVSMGDYLLYVDYKSPAIKSVADKLRTASCKTKAGSNSFCQAMSIYLFVRDRFNFSYNKNDYTFVKGPEESLASPEGDSDDASVLTASLLGSQGIRTRLVFTSDHVYVQAYLPEAPRRYRAQGKQGWVPLDATCKTCDLGMLPFEESSVGSKYIEIIP